MTRLRLLFVQFRIRLMRACIAAAAPVDEEVGAHYLILAAMAPLDGPARVRVLTGAWFRYVMVGARDPEVYVMDEQTGKAPN